MTTDLRIRPPATNVADVVKDICIAMATRGRFADRIAARVTHVNVEAA